MTDPTAPSSTSPVIDAHDLAEARAVVDAFAAAWSSQDLQQVVDLWETDADDVTYVAEELGEVLRSGREVRDHLLRTEHRIGSATVAVDEVHVDLMAPNVVLASFLVRWELEWTSHSRVFSVLRRRHGAWRFIHYMEAPFHKEERSS